MFNKLKNKKGFTLMEMLIVVAIIAILVAIAIPTFNNSLKKAKQATDMANIRAEYAEATTALMLEEEAFPTATPDDLKAKLNYEDNLTWDADKIAYTDGSNTLLTLEVPEYTLGN